jgi:protein-disulfide isomerase
MRILERKATLAEPISALDHQSGSKHAKVVVLEYGDFECPTCQAVEPAVRQLRQLHAATILFVFRNFPLGDVHPHALMAAEATESAAEQGLFWPMHDLLLEPGRHLHRRDLDGFAERIGLNMALFAAELDEGVFRQRVREHQKGGLRSHLRATPTFFVNGIVQDVSGGMTDLFEAVAEVLRSASPGK